MAYRRLMVVGLDCASPRLLYSEYIDELPTLGELLSQSKAYMRSSHPPITIPAWAVMTTGRTPGELGIYGFRHRKPGVYDEFYIVNSRNIKYPRIWDTLSRMGRRSIVVGVPPSYPPRPLRGIMISDFITPSNKSQYTFPPSLRGELESRFGPYMFDVPFRIEDRDTIIERLWKMTRQHFNVLRYLAEKKWDFFMFVEIGVDRVHHAFWGYMDPEHHKYVDGNRYESVIRDYYKLIDSELSGLLEKIPRDTVIIVVSDHGAKAMKGAFAVNQWLAEQGYLSYRGDAKPGTELRDAGVDWRKTSAWGWGGYYARIFVNLKGREPMGTVDPRDYDDFLETLRHELENIRGPNGEKWATKAYRPEELYPVVRGDPPDLIVYFDDLSWRSAGTVGWPSMYLSENDRGPDDAVHDWLGVLSVYDPEGNYTVEGTVDITGVYRLFAEITGASLED